MNLLVLVVFSLSVTAAAAEDSSTTKKYDVLEQWYMVEWEPEPSKEEKITEAQEGKLSIHMEDMRGSSEESTPDNSFGADKNQLKGETGDSETNKRGTHVKNEDIKAEMDDRTDNKRLSPYSLDPLLYTMNISHSPIKVGLKGIKMWASIYLMQNSDPKESVIIKYHSVGDDTKEYFITEKYGNRECSNRLIKTDQELIDLSMYYKEATSNSEHLWFAMEWDGQNVWMGPLNLLPLSSRSHQEYSQMGIVHCKLHKRLNITHLALGAEPTGRYPLYKFTVSTISKLEPPGSANAVYKFIPWET